jgi:hypothetical protein
MKLKFEGTINGQSFDSIKDYNAQLKKLIDDGATNITASSSTKTMYEDEPKELDNYESKFDVRSLLPSYDLHKLTGDANKDDTILCDIQKRCADADNDICNAIDNGVLDDYIDHLLDLEDSMDTDRKLTEASSANINDSINHLKKKMDNIIKKIETKNDQLNVLDNSICILNWINNYIEDAKFRIPDEDIEKRIAARQCEVVGTQTKTDCTSNILEGVKRLLDEINNMGPF